MNMDKLLSRQTFGLLLCCFLLILASACATRTYTWPFRRGEPVREPPRGGWWYAKFYINWPEDIQPFMYIDLCLAHRVLLPVLSEHKDNISLWRFHRRAARDQAGHRFGFIFYASPEVAEEIYADLQNNSLLAEMSHAGLIIDIAYDDTLVITRPHIENTSDPNWSTTIQKSWPYFIMGVSQMWLASIAEIVEQEFPGYDPSSLDEMLTFYEHVDETLTSLWQEEGRHSLLHHLNAIFGYEPVRLNRGDIMFRF